MRTRTRSEYTTELLRRSSCLDNPAPQHILIELNALGDGSGNAIYPGDKIGVGDDRATCCPRANDRRIVNVKFGNSTSDGALRRQIGSDTCGITALSARGAGGWVPENRSFRETTEGEGESGCGLHLYADAGGEEDAGS